MVEGTEGNGKTDSLKMNLKFYVEFTVNGILRTN